MTNDCIRFRPGQGVASGGMPERHVPLATTPPRAKKGATHSGTGYFVVPLCSEGRAIPSRYCTFLRALRRRQNRPCHCSFNFFTDPKTSFFRHGADMCGRYSQTKTDEKKLKKRFKLKKVPKLEAQYNIAPTQPVQAVLNTHPDELVLVRWGLVPNWAGEINSGYAMINARAETLLEKPAYKALVGQKRCLIIADSFYEWKKTGKGKEPYRIMLKDEGLFAFAGLWDCREKNGNELYSCTIITTSANDLVRDIHDRMPVILPEGRDGDWLMAPDTKQALSVLTPCDSNLLKAYRVSNMVNPRENGVRENLTLPLLNHGH